MISVLIFAFLWRSQRDSDVLWKNESESDGVLVTATTWPPMWNVHPIIFMDLLVEHILRIDDISHYNRVTSSRTFTWPVSELKLLSVVSESKFELVPTSMDPFIMNAIVCRAFLKSPLCSSPSWSLVTVSLSALLDLAPGWPWKNENS